MQSVFFGNVEVCFLGKIRQLFQNGAFSSMQIVDTNTVFTLSRPDQTVSTQIRRRRTRRLIRVYIVCHSSNNSKAHYQIVRLIFFGYCKVACKYSKEVRCPNTNGQDGHKQLKIGFKPADFWKFFRNCIPVFAIYYMGIPYLP